MSKEDIIAKIKAIASNEKFKHDAYFLCGFATDKPNTDLLDACDLYLSKLESGVADTAESLTNLIKTMENHVNAQNRLEIKGNILENSDEIRTVLDNRDLLFS